MQPKATIFHFRDYSLDTVNSKIVFNYEMEFSNCDSIKFSETIFLPKMVNSFSAEKWQKLLSPLHLILGISYYKLYCPAKIRTDGKLTKEQANFWNKVYKKGLGEFLYRNKLDPKKVAKFPYSKTKAEPISLKVADRVLLGIGGGKDSIVAAKLLKNFETTSFLVETQKENAISEKIVKQIGNPFIKIQRILDPKIFEIHQGAYNGHIPISAIYAFLGLMSAAVYGYKYVIVANEHSSNFGNLKYGGQVINHQWSKSAEFEAMLQDYTRKFISPDIVYFSLLRQFYEIRIAKMFAKYKKYFPLFTSCNKSFKIFKKQRDGLWCGQCPKCAFTFLMLAPFIPKKELVKIFKKNMLAESDLLPLFRDLLGFGKFKPFDCVGTFKESQAALFLAAKKYKKEVVVKTLVEKIQKPQKLIEDVFKTARAKTVPTPFRFLGINNVCILGYGKEGKISKRYIEKNYPDLKIGILDQNLGKNYLEQQQNYDLAIKTPGIAKDKVRIAYTTATNIFFSQNSNLTIGVTGSAGKSTTASLIYAILKTDGRKVRLVGNIGKPMLEALLTKIDPREIFVIELSSYMLEDIEYSPNIALVVNLFPEHINYHGSVANYYQAKKNIFKYQRPEDKAIKPPFKEKIPVEKKEIPLVGDHNLKNIRAAIKVGRLIGVSDSAIKKAIKNFKPLPHRLEFVGLFKKIKFYDDAISTTPESTIMAIKTIGKIGTIFLGGEDRGSDFRKLEKVLTTYKIKNIVLFPDSGKRILKSDKGFNVFRTRSMKAAVDFAFKNTKEGEICLLSTASASYSLWKNFEEKGNLFQYFVKNYAKKLKSVN